MDHSWDDNEPTVDEPVAYRSVTVGGDARVYHALSLVEPSADSLSAFGADFARYREELGTRKVDYWMLTNREVVFVTDEGDVALGPAEPTVLRVGGERYLTTVLAAWQSDVANQAVGRPKCGGIGDRFAYEMVWLPEDREPEAAEGLEGSGEIEAASSCG